MHMTWTREIERQVLSVECSGLPLLTFCIVVETRECKETHGHREIISAHQHSGVCRREFSAVPFNGT